MKKKWVFFGRGYAPILEPLGARKNNNQHRQQPIPPSRTLETVWLAASSNYPPDVRNGYADAERAVKWSPADMARDEFYIEINGHTHRFIYTAEVHQASRFSFLRVFKYAGEIPKGYSQG